VPICIISSWTKLSSTLTGEAGILMALDPKPIVRGIDIAVLFRADTPELGMLRKLRWWLLRSYCLQTIRLTWSENEGNINALA
jgi:hypothetical protein